MSAPTTTLSEDRARAQADYAEFRLMAVRGGWRVDEMMSNDGQRVKGYRFISPDGQHILFGGASDGATITLFNNLKRRFNAVGWYL